MHSVSSSRKPPPSPGFAVASENFSDFLTIAAIAIVAYAITDFIHEGIGHGGMCLLIGGHPALLSTVQFECVRLVASSGPKFSEVTRSHADARLVAAGGTLANFAAGIISWLALRFVVRASRLRYLLWILMAINFMDAAGYFLFSGVANFGDWKAVISGLQPAWAWHLLLVVAGGALYVAFVRLGASELRPFLGSDRAERPQRVRRLTLTPYFCGSIFLCISALPNPGGMFLVAASAAAAAFGGTSGFVWMRQWFRNPRFGPTPLQMPLLTRSWAWIVSAAILGIAFIAILGPGIRPH